VRINALRFCVRSIAVRGQIAGAVDTGSHSQRLHDGHRSVNTTLQSAWVRTAHLRVHWSTKGKRSTLHRWVRQFGFIAKRQALPRQAGQTTRHLRRGDSGKCLAVPTRRYAVFASLVHETRLQQHGQHRRICLTVLNGQPIGWRPGNLPNPNTPG
jgi:hypothetical protein